MVRCWIRKLEVFEDLSGLKAVKNVLDKFYTDNAAVVDVRIFPCDLDDVRTYDMMVFYEVEGGA